MGTEGRALSPASSPHPWPLLLLLLLLVIIFLTLSPVDTGIYSQESVGV